MNISKLTPRPDQKVRFTLASINFLPGMPGCYALTNFSDDILYVGLTVNLLQRFKQHRESPDKCQPTSLGRAVWFYFLKADELKINAIERAWQNQYSSMHGVLPILNKIDSPIR
jgi:predicted GIY-YIG superfamily endonuclease